MSPRISQYTTELPGSTSRLIGNVGSTTVGFDAGQLLGAVFTSQGQLLFAGSSKNSTFLNPPSSNAILSYSSGSSAPTWIVGSSGQIFYVSSAGLTTILAVPTSGAVLTYSTINSSIGPRWEIPTSGALFGASSVGLPTWIALGTSGQVLESTGGRPTWVAYPADPTTGHITTAGTSGQVLQTTAGAAAWRNSTTIPGTIGSTIGTSGQILQSTGGVATWVTSTGTITTAGTSGQILQTTAGAATWVNPLNLKHIIDVKDYGALGDGITNDNAAFTTAVAQLNNGDVLYIPPGTYILTSAISILNKSMTVRGDGPQVSILDFTGSHGIIAATTASTQAITIEGLTLQTATSGTYTAIDFTGHAIASHRQRQFHVKNVNIKPRSLGANYWLTGISLTEAWNVVIEDSHFIGKQTGDLSMLYGIRGLEQSVAVRISNCWFYDMNYGVSIESSCEGWGIHHSDFVGQDTGILWNTAATLPQLVVDGCHTNTFFRGVDISTRCTGGQVSNCLILQVELTTKSWFGLAVNGAESKNVSFIGNKIVGSATSNGRAVGIDVGSPHCVVQGNIVNDCNEGISLKTGSSYSVAIGNTGSSNTTDLAIASGATSTQIYNVWE